MARSGHPIIFFREFFARPGKKLPEENYWINVKKTQNITYQ